ncbi:unnamed protein product [Ambrosiozyma monospora]|uniref:Unnamed protein product n=1 Tax=Ambrosiozyma monospora TaxID=43982 RepID=A0ACB5U7R1_AMBMO|nr:unnamed protein product [Ambrosiozyma monospora]
MNESVGQTGQPIPTRHRMGFENANLILVNLPWRLIRSIWQLKERERNHWNRKNEAYIQLWALLETRSSYGNCVFDKTMNRDLGTRGSGSSV